MKYFQINEMKLIKTKVLPIFFLQNLKPFQDPVQISGYLEVLQDQSSIQDQAIKYIIVLWLQVRIQKQIFLLIVHLNQDIKPLTKNLSIKYLTMNQTTNNVFPISKLELNNYTTLVRIHELQRLVHRLVTASCTRMK